MGGVELPACAPKADTLPDATRWGAALDVAFAANQASAALSFRYADVGAVELHLRQGGRPARRRHSFPSHGWWTSGASAAAASRRHRPSRRMALPLPWPAKPVLVEIGARVEDAGKVTWAPNFGNETTRPALALGRAALFTDASQDRLFAAGPPLAFDEASWKSAAGKWWVNASWGEVGATTFTIGLPDYLGAGLVTGSGQNVGRFYPAWFTTEITPPSFAAPASPARSGTADPVGVAYSGQQFIARVVARGVQGQELVNFTGAWFRTINLSAVDAKGAAAAAGVLAPLQLNASGTTGSPTRWRIPSGKARARTTGARPHLLPARAGAGRARPERRVQRPLRPCRRRRRPGRRQRPAARAECARHRRAAHAAGAARRILVGNCLARPRRVHRAAGAGRRAGPLQPVHAHARRDGYGLQPGAGQRRDACAAAADDRQAGQGRRRAVARCTRQAGRQAGSPASAARAPSACSSTPGPGCRARSGGSTSAATAVR